MKQILIGCICSLIAVGIASAQEEWMPDSNLRQAVRDELGLPNEIPLQPAEMRRLTRLEASSRQITDLTGLEHAIHLTYLGIARNAIQALTPLSGLIRLESIVGFDNEISRSHAIIKPHELEMGWTWEDVKFQISPQFKT